MRIFRGSNMKIKIVPADLLVLQLMVYDYKLLLLLLEYMLRYPCILQRIHPKNE